MAQASNLLSSSPSMFVLTPISVAHGLSTRIRASSCKPLLSGCKRTVTCHMTREKNQESTSNVDRSSGPVPALQGFFDSITGLALITLPHVRSFWFAGRSSHTKTRGVMICIEKMFSDIDIQDKINLQRDMYKEAFGMFGFSSSQCLKDKKMPSHWWIDCGSEALQLQEFAIRFLSHPYSASSCERNWSVFEHIHNKKRNKLEHERLVFIYYNLQMLTKQVQPKDTDPILLDTIDLESDWVVEEEPPDLSWLDEETEHLSISPSQMVTPNTPASQLLQPSDATTNSTRAYYRRGRP